MSCMMVDNKRNVHALADIRTRDHFDHSVRSALPLLNSFDFRLRKKMYKNICDTLLHALSMF